MRNSIAKAAIITVGAALLLAALGGTAYALVTDSLFPSSIFTLATTPQLDPGQLDYYTNAVGTVSSGDVGTGFLSSGLFSVQDPYAISAPTLLDNSGGSDTDLTMLSPQINDNTSNNVALNSYDNVIGEFPNQSNIFAPYTYSS
jgi:hypothetical protein